MSPLGCTGDDGDDELLALVRGIAPPAPTAAESNRLGRGLEAAIVREQEARRRRISPAFALVAVIASASASAAAVVWLQGPAPGPSPEPVAGLEATTHVGARSVAAPAEESLEEPSDEPSTEPFSALRPGDQFSARAPGGQMPAAAVAVDVAPKRKKNKAKVDEPTPVAVPVTLTWQERADDLVRHDDLQAAARIYAAALVDSDDKRGAALSLWGLAGRDPLVIDALDPLVSAIDDDDVLAQVLRMRCELRLRYRRDTAAIDACRTFGQRFPADPAARALAFGAGGLAEELGDLDNAVEEYSRAILLGRSRGEAVLGRARARTRLGELDEARADLRVYLQIARRPARTHSDEVQGLARALGVELP